MDLQLKQQVKLPSHKQQLKDRRDDLLAILDIEIRECGHDTLYAQDLIESIKEVEDKLKWL